MRGAIFEVHKELGTGLLESVYRRALLMELLDRGLQAQEEVEIYASYKGVEMGLAFRADIIVEERILIETKSVVELHPKDSKQTINYLTLTGIELAFLVNFNVAYLEDKKSLIRIIKTQ